jgi:hypothetical protein
MNTLPSADAVGVVFSLVWPVVLGVVFNLYLQWEARC